MKEKKSQPQAPPSVDNEILAFFYLQASPATINDLLKGLAYDRSMKKDLEAGVESLIQEKLVRKGDKRDYALHGSTQLGFEDTNGDRKPDTIFVGDKYGSSVGVSPQGKVVHRAYSSIGDVVYAVADLNADGKTEVVTGSSTGDMIATSCGMGGNAL